MSNNRPRRVLHLEAQPSANESSRDIMWQRVTPRGARRLNVEFLQNLDRYGILVVFEKGLGDMPLPELRWIATDGLEQNVGV
jgi:hypothetical protein